MSIPYNDLPKALRNDIDLLIATLQSAGRSVADSTYKQIIADRELTLAEEVTLSNYFHTECLARGIDPFKCPL